MSRRKKVQEEEVDTEAWLAIYCDAVTLLLTFFILLYSTATVDQDKFDSISNALKGYFSGGESIMEGGGDPSTDMNIIEDLVSTTQQQKQLKSELENMIKENDLSKNVEVKEDSRGILIELKDSILFDPGSYLLKDGGTEVLDYVYELIGNLKNQISIEGYTDNISNSNSEISNWELSTFRASKVLRYFVEEKGMNPELFNAIGYGEYKPIVDNNNEKNRAKNRRVEILINTQVKEKKSE